MKSETIRVFFTVLSKLASRIVLLYWYWHRLLNVWYRDTPTRDNLDTHTHTHTHTHTPTWDNTILIHPFSKSNSLFYFQSSHRHIHTIHSPHKPPTPTENHPTVCHHFNTQTHHTHTHTHTHTNTR